jgi:hypothetical protein
MVFLKHLLTFNMFKKLTCIIELLPPGTHHEPIQPTKEGPILIGVQQGYENM